MATKKQKKNSAGRRRPEVDNDDPAAFNVRFDYSDVHLDNEDLDLQLEDHASLLHREKYRVCVEVDEILKKTKQDADEMLQLKNAVKNRDPYESSNRVSKSADLKRHKADLASIKDTETKTSRTVNSDSNVDTRQNTCDIGKGEDKEDSDSDDEIEETAPKPVNTLTMFLLSLQTFKRNTNQQRSSESAKCHEHDFNSRKNSNPVPPKLFSKRSSSFHVGDLTIPELPENDFVGKGQSETKYGLHVKRDHTRSRRKLEEISKLEQDSKYGYVNKYEERRKKLLAECKDTKSIEERIKVFLKNVDDFKKESSEENSLEKVLLRSKSAQFTRRNTFAW